mgnify:CR=1 FL=1
MLCFVGMMIAVGVGVKNKPTSQIICGSGIRTAGNTAKQLDASLRKGGLGTGTNPESRVRLPQFREAFAPKEIWCWSICIDRDIGVVLEKIGFQRICPESLAHKPLPKEP